MINTGVGETFREEPRLLSLARDRGGSPENPIGESEGEPEYVQAMRPALLASKIEPGEERRRAQAFLGFQEYVAERQLCELLAEAPCEEVDWILAEYGQHLHDEGAPPTRFKLCILRLQDLRKHWRLRWSWAAFDAWAAGQPAQSYPPAPARVAMAVWAVAVLWGWDSTALGVLLTWAGALRPGETMSLTVGDVHVAGDTGFLVIQEPKTRKRSARKQYVRVWEAELMEVLAALAAGAGLRARVCPLSLEAFRKRMAAITRQLDLPTGQFVGFTPASLRSGRATQLYEFWERQGMPAAELARRLLRHDVVKTTDRYVQEVVAATLHLPALAERKVATICAALPQLFALWLPRIRARMATQDHDAGPVVPLGVPFRALDAADSDTDD